MNIHPVFHVDLLIPYRVTAEYGIPFKYPAPKTIDGQEEYEVNEILAERRHGHKHQHQYLQLLKKLSQCLAILESLTWHKSNKLANILKIIYIIV